jgi:hypothetical protein
MSYPASVQRSDDWRRAVQANFPHICPANMRHGWFPDSCAICRCVLDHWRQP